MRQGLAARLLLASCAASLPKRLADEDPTVREKAEAEWSALAPARQFEVMREGLRGGDAETRRIAALALDPKCLTLEEIRLQMAVLAERPDPMRSPWILFTVGAMIVFGVTHRFWAPGSGKRERNSVIWTNLALVALIGWQVLEIGWAAFLMVELPIMLIACGAGVWLFYVQHNFEGTYWERQEHWSFLQAGLRGSSFYQLPAILQWFSGNIGFHHIHHLNSLIPNYRLPRCHRDNPVFQVSPLTIRKSLRSLRLRLWDEHDRRMVGFEEILRF